MTLDDAIEYYSKTAETLRNQVRIEDNDYMDKVDEVYMCERLAEWLNELKLLRERIDAQPEKRWIPSAKSVQNVPNDDLVSRKTVIEALLRDRQQADALMDNYLKNGYMALRADAKVERNRIEKDIAIVEGVPSVQPDIIHCRDCKHRGEKPIADGRYWCEIHDTFMYYCSDAERRTDE